MKSFVLSLRDCASQESLHSYLQDALSLPDESAESLDDIYDYLTDIDEPLKVTLPQEVADEDNLGEYGERLLTVFEEAAAENPNLEVEII